MKVLGLTRLRPASNIEDRKDFASCFNATLDALGVRPGEDFLIAHSTALDERPARAGRCSLCGEPVDSETALRRVQGWEKKAGSARKGGSDIILRERVEHEVAHEACVANLRRGITPAQGAML